jgi:hypothetical protein
VANAAIVPAGQNGAVSVFDVLEVPSWEQRWSLFAH